MLVLETLHAEFNRKKSFLAVFIPDLKNRRRNAVGPCPDHEPMHVRYTQSQIKTFAEFSHTQKSAGVSLKISQKACGLVPLAPDRDCLFNLAPKGLSLLFGVS